MENLNNTNNQNEQINQDNKNNPNNQSNNRNQDKQTNETVVKSPGKLKNIVDWITEESTKLGYNFSTLPRNKQNQIIEHIMSGLENGFRSRCNYPDLRFAKRRGITKNNNKNGDKNISKKNLIQTQKAIIQKKTLHHQGKSIGTAQIILAWGLVVILYLVNVLMF